MSNVERPAAGHTDETNPGITPEPEPEPATTRRAKHKPPRKGGFRGFVSVVLSVLLGIVMVVLIALSVSVVVAPKLIGATPLTILTGSMEPALSPGDVVVIGEVDPTTVRIDDVVTFQPVSNDPTLVTHRVVAVRWASDGIVSFTTRGDANGSDDDPITPDQVKGRLLYSVPLIGHVTYASWGPKVVTGLAVALILYAFYAVVTPDKSRTKKGRGDDVPHDNPEEAAR